MPDEIRDPELERVLRSWKAQPPTAGFHSRVLGAYVREAELVRAGSATRRERTATWMGALLRIAAVTVLAGAALLVIVSVALPQTHSTVSPPWTVDSEFIGYEENGASSIEMYITSYSVDDSEILLSWALPGSPVKTALGRVLETIEPLFESAERRERDESLKRSHLRHEFITRCGIGCLGVTHTVFSKVERQWTGCVPGTVVGHERILDHQTEAVRQSWMGERGRVTLWTAADLECIALRVTSEEQQPDGSFRLVSEKRALRVNLKP